jgi:hypothetical protein
VGFASRTTLRREDIVTSNELAVAGNIAAVASDEPHREANAPSVGGRRFMIGLLWFGAIATLTYWVIWFGVDRSWLATTDTPTYYAFENAFPLADTWMAITGALAAVALQRRKPSALLWMLLTGSASVFLAAMDVLFDLENGIYGSKDFGSIAVEVFINVACFAGGIAVIVYAWHHRRHLAGL